MTEQTKIELPEKWGFANLKEVTNIIESGKRPKGGVKRIKDGIPSIGGEHLNYDGGFKFDKIKFVPEEFALSMTKGKIKTNDILVVKDGATTGKVSFVDNSFPFKFAVLNEHVFRLEITNKANAKYVFYKLWSSIGKQEILKDFRGAAQGGISTKFINNVFIPLPTLPEQHRIVAKIEELFSELDKAVENLQAAKKQLKTYRQSVLKHAFEGKLTAGWRNCSEFKVQSLKEEELGVAAEPSEEYKKEGDLQIIWEPLEKFLVDIKYGTSQKCSYESEGTGVLRIPNIINGYIDITDLKFSKFDKTELKKYKLEIGDILLIRSNGSISIVGKTAVVKKNHLNFIFAGYLIRLRLNRRTQCPVFYNYLLQSPLLRKQIEAKAKSTSGVNNINSNEINDLKVPVFNIEEQHQIVTEIENRFTVADKMEESIDKSLIQSETLRQSILKKAFEGRLVSQMEEEINNQ